VLDELPRRARVRRGVVVHDHCFGRIVLDHAVGGCWYDVLIGGARPPSPSSTTSGWPRRWRWPSGSRPRATRCCASWTPAVSPGGAGRGALTPDRARATCDDRHMATPAEGLARLRVAAETGELDGLCRRHRIRVLTVFGSAARDDPAARDLDVGVLLEPNTRIDYLPLIRDLELLTEADVDVVHLNGAGPVLRERALVGSVVLDESEPGAWASASTAAVLERMDTEWLRRLDLELLADRDG
jgi:predicted nucleotidyltransferase